MLAVPGFVPAISIQLLSLCLGTKLHQNDVTDGDVFSVH